MGGAGRTQQVWVDALRVEPGLLCQAAQDQERPGAGERSALGVQEELGAMAAVEIRAAAREVAPERVDCPAAHRNDPFLPALADAADEPFVEVDAGAIEARRLADA